MVNRQSTRTQAVRKTLPINTLTLDQLKEAFLAAANAILGPDDSGKQIPYVIDDENKNTINQMLYYFNGMQQFKGDLSRGLIIQGNVGSGKSKLMQIFQLMSLRPFIYKPSRDVAWEYSTKGMQELHAYGKGSVIVHGQERIYKTYNFDDLGAERTTKFFGQEANVMAEIIQARYELFKDGLLTHYTTNLSRNEIYEMYGDRILSRLDETCNWLVLGKGADSTDRRTRKKS